MCAFGGGAQATLGDTWGHPILLREEQQLHRPWECVQQRVQGAQQGTEQAWGGWGVRQGLRGWGTGSDQRCRDLWGAGRGSLWLLVGTVGAEETAGSRLGGDLGPTVKVENGRELL